MAQKYLDYNGLDYFWDKIKAKFAPIDSPTFTGAPTAPTPGTTNRSTQIATTGFVRNVLDTKSFAYYGESATSTIFDTTSSTHTLTLNVTTIGGTTSAYESKAGNLILIDMKTDLKPATPDGNYYLTYLSIDGTTKQLKIFGTQTFDEAVKSGNLFMVSDTGDFYAGVSVGTMKTPVSLTGTFPSGVPLYAHLYNVRMLDGTSAVITSRDYVDYAVETAVTGAAKFQGTVAAQSTITNSNYKSGWYWVVATAGTYVGQACEVGDMIFAKNDKGSSYSASDFNVVQNNLDLVSITNAEIDTITAS